MGTADRSPPLLEDGAPLGRKNWKGTKIMSKDKPTRGGRPEKNTEVSFVRSSAAEYLTFVAASGQGGVETVYR